MRWRPLLAAVLFAALLAPASASAATFTVNVTADGTTCNAITCTLRGAVAAAEANGAAEDDLVVVPAGEYVLTSPLTVSGTRITIDGAGANATIIRAVDTRTLVAAFSSSLVVRDVTLRDGASGGVGGNVWAQSSASLTLERVRITNGSGTQGGGIATQGSARLEISQSLIDGNTATGATVSDLGGGIYIEGQTLATQVTIQDSTIYNNSAQNGGGIGVRNNAGQPPVLRGVTLAANRARASSGVGGIFSAQTNARLQGSILAGNTTRIVLGSTELFSPSNCLLASAPTDEGGNVESDDTCQLGASSRVNTNPQLAGSLDLSAQPPVLAIAAGSPAVDFAGCAGRTVDQRGVPRPQGAACDAGAYEYDSPPETVVVGSGPPFTFSSSDPGSTFQCSLDGGPFVPCTSPWNEPVGPGTHTLVVRAVDPQGQVDGTPETRTFVVAGQEPTPAPTATATPAPTPVAGRIVVAREVRGTVRIRLRGSRRFVNLDEAQGIPVGSTVDTKRGRVEIQAIPRPGRPVEKAIFYDGIFRITQSRGITDLKLTEALACPRGRASAASRKPKKRRLWGDGRGRFRITGRYSAATIRGTKWLVQDTCTSTLTRVTQGVVTVRDRVRKRTIIVRRGKSYVARARR